MGFYKLLQETGAALLQEIGDYILLDRWFRTPVAGIIEIHNTAGDLVQVLENAYGITYVQEINVPHYLKFSLPATDTKAVDITPTNEYWLRDYKTGAVRRKFRLQRRSDTRRGSQLETNVECLDFMSQLTTGMAVDYLAGTTITYMASAASYGGIIHAVVDDATHIFVAGETTNTIRKYLKSDMSLVAESPSYGGSIRALYVDATHVFAAGETTFTVRKYLKTDLTYVTQSPSYGANIYTIDGDDTYIYAVGDIVAGSYYIKKYLKSDLTLSATSPNITDVSQRIKVDATHVYVSCWVLQTTRRYLITTLAYVDTTVAYGGLVYAMAVDDTYVYMAGATTLTIRRYLKSDMSYVSQSPSYGGNIRAFARYGAYLYAAGDTTQTIRRYLLSDLSYSDQSPNYGGAILDMALDGEYAFIGGDTILAAHKYSLFDALNDVIDDLLVFPMQTPVVTKGDISDYADLVRVVKVSGQSLLEALLSLRESVGGYMEVDNDRHLNWYSSIGEDKGQQIRYQKNLLGIEKEVDYSQLFNRIYAYGQDSAGGRVLLSKVQTNNYVEDVPSQTAYGRIFTKAFSNYNLAEAATLLEWANQLLATHKVPPTMYHIETVDLSPILGFDFEELQLGSTITILDEELGISISAIVVKIEHPDLLLNPQDMKIDISNVMENLSNSLINTNSKLQAHEAYLTGG